MQSFLIEDMNEYEVWAYEMDYGSQTNDNEYLEGLFMMGSLADFHYLDMQGYLKCHSQARFEGLHKGYDRMQKIHIQALTNFFKAKPEDEDLILVSELCLHLGQISKDTLLFPQAKSAGPSHYAFVSTTSASKKRCHIADSTSYSSSTYTAPLNLRLGLTNLIEKRIWRRWGLEMQMAMLSVRCTQVLSRKLGRKIDLIRRNIIDGQSDGVIAPKDFGMIAGCDTEDAIEEGAAKIYNLITGADTKEASTAGDAGEFALMGVTSEVHNCPFGCDNKYNELQKQYNEFKAQNNEYFIQVQAYKNSLKTLEKQKRVLQKNQLTLEDKIRVLSIELENTTNLLKHSERINAIAETAKKDLQTKLDNHLVQTEKWRTSSKNLFRLVDSSMSVRTKVGLGFNNYIGENELGWDDSAFSVFTTNSEEVEGRPHFNRFAKTDSMKVVPPPLSGDYTPLSDHTDLDESQMSYGTKSSTSGDSNSVSNDFVSCDNSDKSSEVNSNDFASSDSSVKSSEPKSNDSTSCASTSSISTSESEAEIESNVGTPIQETINVQDLPSFSCNSSDKNGNTSRTSCNKNGYINKKAGHFRKNASSVSKLCFVCGSSTHLIKDCDFYEKQMANKTVGNGVGPVHSRNNVNHQNQYVPHAVLLRTRKVNITPARPQPVPTGKPKVPTPVPTGRQNRPIPVPTGRVDSPSVTSGWKILIQMLKIHTDDNVADLLTKAFDGPRVINSPCYHNKELASPEQTATAEVVPKSVAGSSFPAASSTLLPFDVQFLEGVSDDKNKDAASSRYIQLICVEFSSIQVKTQADWMLMQSSYFNPQGSRLKIYLETRN
ncbi:hypothetical protein Tco_0486840 [Tanacetum coccineum]